MRSRLNRASCICFTAPIRDVRGNEVCTGHTTNESTIGYFWKAARAICESSVYGTFCQPRIVTAALQHGQSCATICIIWDISNDKLTAAAESRWRSSRPRASASSWQTHTVSYTTQRVQVLDQIQSRCRAVFRAHS